MNEIMFYFTIGRILDNYNTIMILHIIQIFSMVAVLVILLYNMIANGNLLECGIFRKLRR